MPRKVTLDVEGRISLPSEMRHRYGLDSGEEFLLEETKSGHLLRPDVRNVYLEVTTRCNLRCCTRVRNVWDEPFGDMSEATFSHSYHYTIFGRHNVTRYTFDNVHERDLTDIWPTDDHVRFRAEVRRFNFPLLRRLRFARDVRHRRVEPGLLGLVSLARRLFVGTGHRAPSMRGGQNEGGGSLLSQCRSKVEG